MTLPRPAGVIGRELVMAKFDALALPAGGLRFLDKAPPLWCRPCRAGSGRVAQFDSVRDALRGAKVADGQFTSRKGRHDVELIRGGVERIPKGLEHLAALLGEDFLRPNGLVQLIFSGFKRHELIDELLADQAGGIGGIGSRRWPSFQAHAQRHSQQQ